MRFAIVIALVIAAVGCGAGSSANAPAPAANETSLKVTVWPQGRAAGQGKTYTLDCAPAKGSLPQPGNSCVKLNRLGSPFAPIRPNIACTEIYGGPQQATVTGLFRGKRVTTTFAARNGCEIARAKKLAFLLPGFGAGASA